MKLIHFSKLALLRTSIFFLPCTCFALDAAPRVWELYVVASDDISVAPKELQALKAQIARHSTTETMVQISTLTLPGLDTAGEELAKSLRPTSDRCKSEGGRCIFLVNTLNRARALTPLVSPLPLLFVSHGNPLDPALAANLRTARNATGFNHAVDVSEKWLELLTQCHPKARKMAIVMDSQPEDGGKQAENLARLGEKVGIAIKEYRLSHATDIATTFGAIKRDGMDAVIIPLQSALISRRKEFFAAAIKSGLPNIVEAAVFLKDGAWLAYQPDGSETAEVLARQIRLIVTGTPIHLIPVEYPKKFRLWVNVGAAKQARFTIPKSILLQATDIVDTPFRNR